MICSRTGNPCFFGEKVASYRVAQNPNLVDFAQIDASEAAKRVGESCIAAADANGEF